jgi:hypothetical protein
MEVTANTELLVLHALRLSGFASTDAVARRWEIPTPDAERALDAARTDGWVSHRDGRLTGWMLTTEGRSHAEALLADELDERGMRRDTMRAYDEFGPLNVEFLSICTEWQLRTVGGEQVLNDHSDSAHDRAVLARLVAVHEPILRLVRSLSAALPRFASYSGRFSHAYERVLANDVDWLTRPVIDSYHTVWFELHEDLLATLGRSRSADLSAGRPDAAQKPGAAGREE